MTTAATSALTFLCEGALQEAHEFGYLFGRADDISWVKQPTSSSIKYTIAGYSGPSGFKQPGEGVAADPEELVKAFKGEITAVEYRFDSPMTGIAFSTLDMDAKVGLAKKCGALARQHYGRMVAAVLNACTSTDGPDGAKLASTLHPLLGDDPNGTRVTFSNYANASLSATNWSATCLLMRNTPDHRGVKGDCEPMRLIVPTDLAELAKQIRGSSHTSNDLSKGNFLDQLEITVMKGLTSASRWFVEDDNTSSFVLPIVKGPQLREYVEPLTGIHHYLDEIYAGIGFGDARGLVVG